MTTTGQPAPDFAEALTETKLSNTSGAYVATAHWSVRVWRKLGFYGSFDEALFDWRQDVPKDGDLITTETRLSISFLDRLRILVTGHATVCCYIKTEHHVGKTETRSDFAVMP